MFSEEINKVGNSGEAKAKLLKINPFGYTISSALAGIYVGIGIILIFTIGGFFNAANSPATKLLMGVSFGIELSLVIMAGSELFTGNNMVMTVSSLDKKTTWGETFKVWIVSYLGNFIGSALLASFSIYVCTKWACNRTCGKLYSKNYRNKNEFTLGSIII